MVKSVIRGYFFEDFSQFINCDGLGECERTEFFLAIREIGKAKASDCCYNIGKNA
jgi:hypothetical protein